MTTAATPTHPLGDDAFRDLVAGIAASADGITIEDRSGRVRYVNRLGARMYGFPSVEDALRAAQDSEIWPASVHTEHGVLLSASDRPAVQVIASAEAVSVIVRLAQASADDAGWYSVRATPVWAEAGELRGVITVWHDVTALKRSESTQRLLAEASAALVTSLDVEATLAAVARMAVPALADWCVVFLLDDNHVIRRVELAASDPWREEVLRTIQERFPPVWDSPLPAARVIRSGEPIISSSVDADWLREYTVDENYGPLAAEIGLRSTMVVPLVADGRPLGALSFGAATAGRFGAPELAVAMELASRAAYAVDHARLYAASREAVDARDRFLSIAAHELRTPVAVMKAFAELLEREQSRGSLTPARTTHLISRIVSGANRLDHLTSEVLDVARSHLGQLPLRPRPFDLVMLVGELVERSRERAGETHQLVLRVPPMLEVHADPERIEQVVINLIENALKYSPTGGTVEVEIAAEDDGVRLSVLDDGIGLPPGAADTIFSPFERAANASEHGIPGLGLGLYIGRSFVERHGGRIWAESAGEHLGTTVSFWLPLQAEVTS